MPICSGCHSTGRRRRVQLLVPALAERRGREPVDDCEDGARRRGPSKQKKSPTAVEPWGDTPFGAGGNFALVNEVNAPILLPARLGLFEAGWPLFAIAGDTNLMSRKAEVFEVALHGFRATLPQCRVHRNGLRSLDPNPHGRQAAGH